MAKNPEECRRIPAGRSETAKFLKDDRPGKYREKQQEQKNDPGNKLGIGKKLPEFALN
ncbi:MAG: hypothetical protein ABSB82_16345 [Terriglobia bacterium]